MLIAFSHLRWGFVWQRPQHLLSRFARTMPVLVVEEPTFDAASVELRMRQDRGVTIATPHLPASLAGGGFGSRVNHVIADLLDPLVREATDLIVWYYTPMALGAAPSTRPCDLAVYDAMDDLALFKSAPPALRAEEMRLLAQVDLVFTGGPTLYRQRRHKHQAVHCFPSGVEAEHFGAAGNGIPRSTELDRRARPILGYFGVIDERVDLDLLARVADLRPEWTIALIGPTAKIDAASIPTRDNIIRFAQQDYEALPAFLACFDVAMLPFARNDATRAISPTKTLEYLAGGKPVVSTPIADVVELYGDVVSVAATAAEFVAQAEALLTRSTALENLWRARVEAIVSRATWDAIAAEMARLIDQARCERGAASARENNGAFAPLTA
jgi:UDP-galactopyranose mutase